VLCPARKSQGRHVTTAELRNLKNASEWPPMNDWPAY